MTYVYPVLSRRSGGISIGINLNINNACNWSCIYCQVPNLIRGNAPPVDLDKLEHELRNFLADVIDGDFYKREQVPEELQTVKDIALSGNGEPTTADEFDQVVDTLEPVLEKYGLLNSIKCVLITNGSMVNRETVKNGLKKLAKMNGEVWFKVDSATPTGMARINHVKSSNTSILSRLKICSELCPTLIQTCVFSCNNKPPSKSETSAYIDLLKAAINSSIPIKGVLLYGIERPSMQCDSDKLNKVSREWLNEFERGIRNIPLDVTVTP